MDIESADVIRLIEQFLKEHNLKRTLDVLQSESSIRLNTIDNIDIFKSNILKGRWDIVLSSVVQANIEPGKLIDLYEQIIFELAELLDLAPARALLRQTEPMQILRTDQPSRYLELEQLLSRTTFDADYAYKGKGTKESRRAAIAECLTTEVASAPPSRLLTLLGQALKWQQEQGIVAPGDSYDLFYGTKQVVKKGEDQVPSKVHATIKFPKKQHPESLAFSPSGDYIATGSADGFIEIWNPMTGKLRTDLKYQADSALMMMDQSVTCLSISENGEAICSGSTDGKIKVWN
ncbi:Serine/threonine-protein kinase smu1, partial [Linderina macrospora]